MQRQEGVLVGISSGAALHGQQSNYAKRPENKGKSICSTYFRITETDIIQPLCSLSKIKKESE